MVKFVPILVNIAVRVLVFCFIGVTALSVKNFAWNSAIVSSETQLNLAIATARGFPIRIILAANITVTKRLTVIGPANNICRVVIDGRGIYRVDGSGRLGCFFVNGSTAFVSILGLTISNCNAQNLVVMENLEIPLTNQPPSNPSTHRDLVDH